MSTLAYIAGASVERNINEAIRTEEIRAHGAELQNLAYRFQARIDELYEDNLRLRKIIDAKDLAAGQREAEIDGLAKKLESTRKYVKTLKLEAAVEEMTQHVMVQEVEAVVGSSLAEIIESAFKCVGQEVNEDVSRYIREKTNIALGLSSDSSLRTDFYMRFSSLLKDRRIRGEKDMNYMEMADCAIRIASRVKEEKESEGKKEVNGKADFKSVIEGLETKKKI